MKHDIRSFKELALRRLDNHRAKQPFLVNEKRVYTYHDLLQRLGRLTAFFRGERLSVGSKVLLSSSDDYSQMSLFLALVSNGVAVIIVDPDSKKERVKGIFSQMDVDGWIVDQAKAKTWGLPELDFMLSLEPVKNVQDSIMNKLLGSVDNKDGDALSNILNQFEPSFDFPEIQGDEIAYIIFTSGTTSDPKGIQISHKNLTTHLATLMSQYELNNNSVICNFLSLAHADGLIQGPVLAYFGLCTLSRPFAFDVGRISELFDSFYKYRVSHFITAPAILTLLQKFSDGFEDSFHTPEFKFIISTAAPLETTLWRDFMDTFKVKVVNTYGLTETVAESFYCGPGEDCWKVGSIGKPVDCEARIVDERGVELGSNEVGELLIKGDHVMHSYVNSDIIYRNDWFPTGDLAVRDDEGFYYIKGRKKSLIIRGGINISPEEITEVLDSHPLIGESCVYGQHDEVWGEKVVAVVVPEGEEVPKEREVRKFCKDYLEDVKTPSEIFVVKELPKGSMGKVQLERLKATIEEVAKEMEDSIQHGQISVREDVLTLASSCFNASLGIEDMHRHSNNVEGWNSLDHLEFVTRLEKHFEIHLSPVDIMNISSLASAERIVLAKVEG